MSERGLSEQGARTALLVVLAATFMAYLPALSTGFVADDFFILSRLAATEQTGWSALLGSGFFEYYRPLVFLSHAVDWRVWHAQPFGFHLTNLLLHLGSVVIVYVLGRRILTPATALLGAALFALHAASHEVVYWMAARFDGQATFLALASLLALRRPGAASHVFGAALFGLALLSKESALSLLVMAPAWDVLIENRPWREALRRWTILMIVVVAFAAARALATDVDVAGGTRRLPKLAMTLTAAGSIFAYAWWRQRGTASLVAAARTTLALAAVLASALLTVPATASWMMEKAGFAAYAAWHSLTPVITWSPAPDFFAPGTLAQAAPGALVIVGGLVVLVASARLLANRRSETALLVFIAGALIPVSSMVGGVRYLYLASAGTSFLLAALVGRVSRGRPVFAGLLAGIYLAISAVQIFQIGASWHWSARMTREGVARIAARLAPCADHDALLLTTPIGIRNVYGNFYYEAFEVLEGCSPRSLQTVLRIVREDATITVDRVEPDRIVFRINDYRGNAVGSRDLRSFTVELPPGATATIDTPVGALTTFPEGSDQVFELALSPAARSSRVFYYSAGAVHPVR